MRTVWKYDLALQDEQIFPMPAGARVLLVDVQDGALCLWAEVETNAPPELRRFFIVGTGHPIPEGIAWLGSVQMQRFVWHVFAPTGEVDRG